MPGIDAVLQVLPDGMYDLQIGPDGDILTADSFDTAIIVSLFTDRRAGASEVGASRNRRGWIGNESTPGIEMGSKLWLFEQARNGIDTMNGLADAAQAAIQWLVDDGFAVAVSATATPSNVSLATLSILIERVPGEVERRDFELWQNTGVS